MSTYEMSMNLTLNERGGLTHTHNGVETVWHPPIEIPPAPDSVSDEAWRSLHHGFIDTYTTLLYSLSTREDNITVFKMTEAERLQWCAEYDSWEDEILPSKSDRDRDAERLYYSGFGDRVGLDPFAYDSQGNDTGLRESDFI